MMVFIGIVSIRGYVMVFMKIASIKKDMRWFFMQIVAFKTYYLYEKGLCVYLGDG